MEWLSAQYRGDGAQSSRELLLWKGMRTIARLVDAVYEKGVKVCGGDKTALEHRLERSTDLNWWDITIHPKMVLL